MTDRIPYSNKDAQRIIDYIKMSNGKGYDITMHPILKGSVKESLEDGVLILNSLSLDLDVVFINANGGKGLFGGQKRSILSYIGSLHENQLVPGPVSKSLLISLTSVNNIFRDYG